MVTINQDTSESGKGFNSVLSLQFSTAWEGSPVLHTGTHFFIVNGSYSINAQGSGFTYDGSDKLSGGTITYLSVGTPQGNAQISDISFNASTLYLNLQSDNESGLLSSLLGSGATFVSSSLADTIVGGGFFSNDTFEGGTADDIFIGGFGNDSYEQTGTGVTIIEDSGGFADFFTDTIYSANTMVIRPVSGIEQYALVGTVNANLTGSSLADYLIGNDGANLITGGAGNDTLDGGGFVPQGDTLIGGAGNDVYVLQTSEQTSTVKIVEGAGGGNDTVIAYANFTLGGAAQVENLVAVGTEDVNLTGNSFANVLTGNGGDNSISGMGGNDTLVGGSGEDLLYGGAGNDVYQIFGSDYDTIVEETGGETDTVIYEATSNFSGYSLGAELENLTVTGTYRTGLYGNDLANKLTGSSASNTLTGNGGKDTLIGGAGDDVYYELETQDKVVEVAGTAGGIDEARFVDGTPEGASLVPYANVENLMVEGMSNGTLTGNALNNFLKGNAGINSVIGGAGNDTLQGNGTGLMSTLVDTLIGGAGNDVYYFDDSKTVIVEAKNGGSDTVIVLNSFSLGDTLAGGINVENAWAATSFRSLTGNSLANVLGSIAGYGSNTLYGGDGNDTLISGASDTLQGDAGNDVYDLSALGLFDTVTVIEESGTVNGIDTVIVGSLNYTLAGGIENGIVVGNVGGNLRGNELANKLTGGSLRDVLYSVTGSLADTLAGGGGNDSYNLDSTNVKIVEVAGTKGGLEDTVYANVDIDLNKFANVENVDFDGQTGAALKATGNALNNYLKGNVLDNTLKGGGGNDTLDGNGASDNDVLDGGAGNDVFYFRGNEAISDSGGNDTVIAINQSFSSIGLYSFIENIVLEGCGNSTATGNSLANVLKASSNGNSVLEGNGGNDTLYAFGATDTLRGGAGNDVYVLDHTGHIIDESTGSGIDTVVLTEQGDYGSYLLQAGFENLTLSGSASYVQLSGNELANVIRGGSGNDNISAGGDSAKDTLYGGAGNDFYTIDGSLDTVKEDTGTAGGHDTVASYGNYTLPANVENLYLSGTAAIKGTGNALDNVLKGSEVSNVLNGAAGNDTLFGPERYEGAQVDTLTGGAGADVFAPVGDFLGLMPVSLDKQDYALITDFNFAQGDRLALLENPLHYGIIGQVDLNTMGLGSFGAKDRGLYLDTDLNGVYNPGTDDFVAIVRSTGATALTGAQLAVSGSASVV